ncbi:MAG TPA: XRE family transcriptional regulator [Terriglobales bacterium]|jgi:SOS-response transcriptional repressor LexA|nr:XRE family transcriptional regulator [Terriglobales bacterium]
MRKTSNPGEPEWAKRINALRHRLGLSQSELGKRLDASAMAVSRWERGVQEPPANINIQLGNLTGDPECWYFWGRAGLHSDDLMRVLPAIRSRLRRDRPPSFQIVQAGAHRVPKKQSELVAIPVLPVVAATHGGKGDPAIALQQAVPDSLLAAPNKWCPNPAYTSCLTVRGRSMMPLIHDGYIIVVDTSQTNRRKLYGQIVVAAHKEQGLIVSRLQRYDDTEVLVPENREYDSTALSTHWRIIAKILWWIGRSP